MIIRAKQMEAFDDVAIRLFEQRTYLHLEEYFPNHCRLLGERQMLLVIRHGWEKSKSYGFTAECCVRSYIERMCQLGGGFDDDVLLPWAREILIDHSSPDQILRGDRLYEKTGDYIDQIARDYRDAGGKPTTARFMNDLREVRHLSEEPLTPSSRPGVLESIESRLKRLFPSKCAYAGQENVRRAITKGVEAASRYGITSERGTTLFAALRFVLGAGFDQDLLLPWASKTLKDYAIPDQNTRVDKLYSEAVSCLRRWWGSAPQAREVPPA